MKCKVYLSVIHIFVTFYLLLKEAITLPVEVRGQLLGVSFLHTSCVSWTQTQVIRLGGKHL